MKEQKQTDFINGPLLPTIIKYSIPLMLTNLLQQSFSAIDTIIIGQFGGDNAMAAVGATGSLISLFIALFNGLSMGATVVVAQLIGKGNMKDVKKSVDTSYALGINCGILVTGLGILFSRFFLSLSQL